MVEMSTIIRYIRIFSELAGQIKYASQKRILVEIALIKLCKPSMETSQEALLDRIRDVEEKVENGVPVVMTEGAMSMAVTTSQKRPELPKAIPEEVKEIVSNWPTIIGNTDNPMRIYLKNANLSLGGDNKLMVVLEDGTPSDHFTEHPENKAQLETVIADFLGKEVEVTIQSVRSRQEFKENYVDLSQIIHMDIEVEEE